MLSDETKAAKEFDFWCSVFVAGYTEALRTPVQLAPKIEQAIAGCAAAAQLRKRLHPTNEKTPNSRVNP